MEARAFIDLVANMRAAQKKYFKERGKANMLASMEIEKQVDQALDEGITIPEDKPKQLDMFAAANAEGEANG
jgi:hypothetical protein